MMRLGERRAERGGRRRHGGLVRYVAHSPVSPPVVGFDASAEGRVQFGFIHRRQCKPVVKLHNRAASPRRWPVAAKCPARTFPARLSQRAQSIQLHMRQQYDIMLVTGAGGVGA
jgi:hypothetical protein